MKTGGTIRPGLTSYRMKEKEGCPMRSNRIVTATVLALLLALACTACASAAEIRPIPVDHDGVDLSNGKFELTIRNVNRIENGDFFTAVLYLEDRYDGEQIQNLAPGDTVYADDRKWTVKDVVIHKDEETPDDPAAYEIYPEEETGSYLAFWPRGDGTYTAVIDDWCPVVLLGSVQVGLPLAEEFEYIRISAGEEQEPEGAQAFIDDLKEYSADSFTAYNTTGVFRDGALVQVISSSYPQGPEAYEEPEAVPVWKFCHGLRDGLDTAVITAYTTDCEAGPAPAEITPEEAEQIRRLAMYGTVTGKANDLSVTGGTWVYIFETPGGKQLLAIEMYKGLIVAADGMYRYGE